MATIRGYGTYLPRYRIDRSAIADQHGAAGGGGETAVPAHDEDVISIGVAAAKNALEHADVEGPTLGAIVTASTSDPFDERGIAPHIALAVGASPDIRVADLQGSARAGMSAVTVASDLVEAGTRPALVVASELLRAEPGSAAERTAGAGGGALVLDADGETDDPVASIEASVAETTGFVGRFTPATGSPVSGDGRFNRERFVETTASVLDRLATDPPDSVVLAPHEHGWGTRAIRTADIEADHRSTFEAVGDLGAAGALVDTALTFEAAAPDETVVTVGYGAGGADGVRIRTGPGVTRLPPTTTTEYLDSKAYVTYAKHLDYRGVLGGSA